MSEEGASGVPSPVPITTCRVCQADPPAGNFCGVCGSALTARRGDGTAWLRLRTYAAAPKEHVLRAAVVSSLFPRLSHRSRAAFRTGLLALAVLLAACAALRWQGPLIGVCALGLPVLFAAYLYESGALADMSFPGLLVTVTLEAGLGIGWALVTGPIIARTYDDVLGSPPTVGEQLVDLVVIPFGAVCLMLLPLLLLRLLRHGVREALDGFTFGALSALCFTAAGTLTRLAPQFTTGLIADDRPITDFLLTALIQGIAVPLTAAAMLGTIGTTAWFAPRRRRWTAFAVSASAIVVGLLAYLALGWIDDFWLPQGVEAALYIFVTLLAILVLRVVLQACLLSEKPDPADSEMTVLCPQCDHVVPDLAFCPSCGVAAHAASRSSRHVRRANRPVPIDPASEGR